MFEPITLENFKLDKPEWCFHSVRTVWWTTDQNDLQSGPVPLDIFGSPNYQTNEQSQIMQMFNVSAIKKQKSYGKYPITCFAMAHHKNLSKFIEEHDDLFPQKNLHVSSFSEFHKVIDRAVDEGILKNIDLCFE